MEQPTLADRQIIKIQEIDNSSRFERKKAVNEYLELGWTLLSVNQHKDRISYVVGWPDQSGKFGHDSEEIPYPHREPLPTA